MQTEYVVSFFFSITRTCAVKIEENFLDIRETFKKICVILFLPTILEIIPLFSKTFRRKRLKVDRFQKLIEASVITLNFL